MTRFAPTLASLRTHEVPSWYHDAKLGIFIHWTLAAVPGFAPREYDIQQLTPAAATPSSPAPHTIDVRVESIAQLFNSFDPAPFHRKDLDQDAEEFIVSSARELPRGAPLRLVIHMPALPAPDERAVVIDAVHKYFAYRAEIARRDFRYLMREGQTSLVIGLLFLAACLLTARFVVGSHDDTFSQIAREGLTIGGWVAMWRPIGIFLYDWWPLGRRRRMFESLSRMDVGFVKAT